MVDSARARRLRVGADALTSHVMLDIVPDATNSASAFVLGLRLNGLILERTE